MSSAGGRSFVIVDLPRKGLPTLGLALIVLAGLAGCASAPSARTALASGASSASATTSTEGGPDVTSVGFSTGGSECSLGVAASSFAAGVPIHTVLTMSPPLPAGGTVTVSVEKDGVEVADARQTINMSEPAPCVWGTLPELEAGHYRMTYAITPSAMPPVSGEFDVTP